MIARQWRGRVPADRVKDYFALLERTGLADYTATPGHRGTLVLLDRDSEAAEFTLLTLWESMDAVKAFAGDDPGRARYYPGDGEFLLDFPERVRHYEVLADEGFDGMGEAQELLLNE